MLIVVCYGVLFQMSYVICDFDVVMVYVCEVLGIVVFYILDFELEVLCYGEWCMLVVWVVMVNIGSCQFEIIELVFGVIEVYIEVVDFFVNILNFYYIVIVVCGDYVEWQVLLVEVVESGDVVVYFYLVDQDFG